VFLRPLTNRGRRRVIISVESIYTNQKTKIQYGGDATFDFILTNIILKLTNKKITIPFFCLKKSYEIII